MPQKPKDKRGQSTADTESQSSKSEVGRDQKERRYYYDDAHGYEDFDPETAEDDDEARNELC